jgi:D-glycero-D-manno-heptose 1,7-bisphosphate phosphatase
METAKSAVFLDRDGTLIEEVGYLKDIKDIKLIEGSSEGIKKLNENGILTILITNQSGVARGYFDENNIVLVNNELARILEEKEARLDGIYYCPHHKDGIIAEYAIECQCRKPKTGLLKQATEDFKNINLKKSYVIGDKTIDIELAKNAGCKGILVRTGYGSKVIDGSYDRFIPPDYIADNLNDAANWIIQDLSLE